jgi:hypothetical protein
MQQNQTIAAPNPEVGEIYVDARPPRREWRVTQIHDGTITLERIDKPSTLRFVNIPTLHDSNRYLPKR